MWACLNIIEAHFNSNYHCSKEVRSEFQTLSTNDQCFNKNFDDKAVKATRDTDIHL